MIRRMVNNCRSHNSQFNVYWCLYDDDNDNRNDMHLWWMEWIECLSPIFIRFNEPSHIKHTLCVCSCVWIHWEMLIRKRIYVVYKLSNQWLLFQIYWQMRVRNVSVIVKVGFHLIWSENLWFIHFYACRSISVFLSSLLPSLSPYTETELYKWLMTWHRFQVFTIATYSLVSVMLFWLQLMLPLHKLPYTCTVVDQS